MIYHVVCIKSNTTSATSGAGPAGTAGAPEFTPSCMSCSCSSIFRLHLSSLSPIHEATFIFTIPHSWSNIYPHYPPFMKQHLSSYIHTPSCMSCSCSSIFRLMFYRSLFVICLFSVDHCVVCPSINSFWLLLWYHQTFLHRKTGRYFLCSNRFNIN
jgi:hypothetical protein